MVDTTEWASFNHTSIEARFPSDNSAASTLPEFVSAELARISHGCASDNNHLVAGAAGFHRARQTSPGVRKLTRAHGLHVVNDMIEALDRTTSLGSVTFHIHGESPPGSTAQVAAGRNVLVFASHNILNNSAATAGLEQMRAIFESSVAVPFVHDWLRRSVASNTLSASVLSPPSSPIKRPDTLQSSQPRVRPSIISPSLSSALSSTESQRPDPLQSSKHRVRPAHSSPSISTASSLTESSHSRVASTPPSTPTRRGSKQTFPISPGARVAFSSSFVLDTGRPALRQDSEAPDYSVLPRQVTEFLQDIGKASGDDVIVVTTILESCGQELWATTISRQMHVSLTTARTMLACNSPSPQLFHIMPKAIKRLNAPVRKRPKVAASTAAIREQKRKSAKAAAQDLNSEVKAALDTIDDLIDSIANKHGKSFEYVQEAVHLGGHVLKAHRRPGINNAWAHCDARSDTDWLDDPAKNHVKAIVNAARKLPGSYRDLSQEQQQVLVDQLAASRAEEERGIGSNPAARIQDARSVLDRIRRELVNLQDRDKMEFLFIATTGSTRKVAITDTFLTPSATAFITTVTKTNPSDWIASFEAFAVNGVSGLLHNHELRKDNMKSHIRETLRDQIGDHSFSHLARTLKLTFAIALLSGKPMHRLEFGNYERRIVEKLGVVIEGWTCPNFVSPSHFKLISQVEELYRAVNDGTCYARKLDKVEYDARILSNQTRAALGEDVYGTKKGQEAAEA
ncbi:hypothetical protein HWV62_23711 [Athelia sp. TMB]|nr:hypothetical protein HWV62_23711 [Athelia sp. TMB]